LEYCVLQTNDAERFESSKKEKLAVAVILHPLVTDVSSILTEFLKKESVEEEKFLTSGYSTEKETPEPLINLEQRSWFPVQMQRFL
jgi:hypothetical protein